MSEEYGPNTALLKVVLEEVKSLTKEQNTCLAKSRNQSYETSWIAVRTSAMVSLRKADRKEAFVAAKKAVREGNSSVTSCMTWEEVDNAVLAVIVKDLIRPEQFDLLYGPWRSVVENG